MATEQAQNLLARHYEKRVSDIRLKLQGIREAFSGVHEGEKGRSNEQVLGAFLREFLPGKYSIGDGFVVDSHGGVSKQCDLILHDRLFNPELFALGPANFYPVEVVYATVEVKTSLDRRAIEDVAEKVRSVKGLQYERMSFSHPTESGLAFGMTKPPVALMFAYENKIRRAETILGHFRSAFAETSSDLWIDCGCILSAGVVANAHMGKGSPEMMFFHYGCLSAGEDGSLIEDVANNKTARHVDIEGRKYPTIVLKGENYVVDPVRNFLMFLSMAYEFLNKKAVPEVQNILQLYIPPQLKRRVILRQEEAE